MAEQKFTFLQIANHLKISGTTVYKYLEMTVEEATEWASSLSSRRKSLTNIETGLWLGYKNTLKCGSDKGLVIGALSRFGSRR